MSFRSVLTVFMRSRQLLVQLIRKKKSVYHHQKENHEIPSNRQCFQLQRELPNLCQRSANLFRRYSLFRILPQSSFRGFAVVLRRNATMRLMASHGSVLGRGSLFAFVGLSMIGSSVGDIEAVNSSAKHDTYDDFCSIIRKSFQRGTAQHGCVRDVSLPEKVSGYVLDGEPLGSGCNGLIFAARVKNPAVHNPDVDGNGTDDRLVADEHKDNKDGWRNTTNTLHVDEDDTVGQQGHILKEAPEVSSIAIKMTFNLYASSNAESILREFERELVPLNSLVTKGTMTSRFKPMRKRPLSHPNIVDVYSAFVDSEFPHVDYILKHHPACLPHVLNPGEGFGRSSTLFITMKRYDMNLKQYLQCYGRQSERDAMVMITQLLEGVSYLVSQGIAHRDLKNDNILVDLRDGYISLVISDFGCCLVQEDRQMCLSYNSAYVDKGGNSALMAPEVKLAVPGEGTVINYWKSDAWAIGAIAYEILGLPNPFSAFQNAPMKCLDSRDYKESDLPDCECAHPMTSLVIKMLLKRNPQERLTAEVAANIMHLSLWQPEYWKNACWDAGHVTPTIEHIFDWLEMLFAETRMKCVAVKVHWAMHPSAGTEQELRSSLLRRIAIDGVMQAVEVIQSSIMNDFLVSRNVIALSKL